MISLRCDAMSPSSAVARLSRCEESCEVTFLSPTRTIRLTRRDTRLVHHRAHVHASSIQSRRRTRRERHVLCGAIRSARSVCSGSARAAHKRACRPPDDGDGDWWACTTLWQ